MFRSLRVRMALSHAGVLVVIILAIGGIGQVLLARTLDRNATAEIVSAAQQEVDRLGEAGKPESPPDSDVPSQSVVRLAVFTPSGAPVGDTERVPRWLSPHQQRVTDVTAAGEPARVVTLAAREQGRLVGIVVAGRSLTPERTLLHRVRLLLVVGGLAAILASLAAGWWLAGRAVRPVRRAYEAQSGFAADASHELRTPLAFVRSGVEVLADRDPPLGEEVLSEIDYLTSLTGRLLLLARADGHTLHVQPEPLDISALCEAAAKRARSAHGIRLGMPEPNGFRVMADGTATQAALDALFENVAVHGGGEAEITWEERDGRVVLSVVDHGQGQPTDSGDAPFGRFFRADAARTRDGGGAGLGLPIARALLEAEGGKIWLEPSSGGGLTARISLPKA
jgi:signal transduction histidine kinase